MADHRNLTGTGFYVDIDRVKGLPGFPNNESLDCQVVFNPQSANLSLGPVETLLPIKVRNVFVSQHLILTIISSVVCFTVIPCVIIVFAVFSC